MATKEEIKDYKKKEAQQESAGKTYKVLNVLTGIISVIWSLGLAGVGFALFFMNLNGWDNNFGGFIACLCVLTLYGVPMITFGILGAVRARNWIDRNDSLAFGVAMTIFTLILPGVLYLATRHLDKVSREEIVDPEMRDSVTEWREENTIKSKISKANKNTKSIVSDKNDIRRW